MRTVDRAGHEAEVRYWLTATIAMLVYSTVLFYSYRDLVSPRYGYLPYRTPDQMHYWIAFGLTVLTALILPRRMRKASDMAQWLLFLTAQAPMMLLAQYMDRLGYDEALLFALQVAACTVLIRVVVARVPHPPRVVRPGAQWRGPSPWFWLGLVAVVVYSVLIATVGLSTQWLSFADVYDAREEFSAVIAPVPFVGYLVPVLSNAINPAFIARGIYSLRWRFVIIGVAGQLVIYATTSAKVTLFSAVALTAMALLFRSDLRLRGTRLFWAISGACLTILALDTALNSHLWTDMFIRRFVIIPGGFAVVYTDMFKGGARPHGHFTDTPVIGDAFGTNPYPRGASYVVGETLTGSAQTDANVNIFGNGYYQAGFVGMLIESVLLALILVALNWATRGLPAPVASLMVFMPTIVLSGTGVFTAVTSHGIPAAILVCLILPATGWGRQRRYSAKVTPLSIATPLRA